MEKMRIDVIDNEVPLELIGELQVLLPHLQWKLEYDIFNGQRVQSGMTADLEDNWTTRFGKVAEKFITDPDLRISRAYINYFTPNEKCYPHKDECDTTVLFYCNFNPKVEDGGETIFFRDGEIIKSVLPKMGRMVLFDGDILHSARPFNNDYRYTVALKMVKE
jgi:Rps23 Pro-64 3,4-dihydroxylase Tpa1-like proline 4-hydroxylase